MPIRQPAHAEEEKAIFEAFLSAYPAFKATIKEVRQPDAEFPDAVATMLDGSEVDFELGEWLHGAQMGQAKRRERLVESIERAIGPQGPNPSVNFRYVTFTPREDTPPVATADKAPLKTVLAALIEETERRWAVERHWRSPQGHDCRELAAYPPLGKYLVSVHFHPLMIRGEARSWISGQPWIFPKSPGGPYSPETAFGALADILRQKIGRYGPFSRPTRLIIITARLSHTTRPTSGSRRGSSRTSRCGRPGSYARRRRSRRSTS